MDTMRSALGWSILVLTGFTLLAATPHFVSSAAPGANVDPLLPYSSGVLLALCALLIAVEIAYTRHAHYDIWIVAAGGACIAMLGFDPAGTAYARLVILLIGGGIGLLLGVMGGYTALVNRLEVERPGPQRSWLVQVRRTAIALAGLIGLPLLFSPVLPIVVVWHEGRAYGREMALGTFLTMGVVGLILFPVGYGGFRVLRWVLEELRSLRKPGKSLGKMTVGELFAAD
jgi:hypothetical protein